jgi:hypothetical protein
MSGAVAAAPADSAALARDLLRRALTTFAAVPPDDRGPALLALDEFLAAPGPAAYLAAVRILAEARRTGALRQVRSAQTGYAFARGLDAVRRELGASAAASLAAIPAEDHRAGHRLRALALLAAAHRELAERVAGSTELLRKQLGLAKEKPDPVPAPRRPSAAWGRPPAKRRRA